MSFGRGILATVLVAGLGATEGADPCSEVSDPAVSRGMTALDIAVDRGNAAVAAALDDAMSTCG